MGISGPVLAFLTATLFAAFKGVFGWTGNAYAGIMLGFSAILAVFPVVKESYATWLKVVLWPIATVMIFASAWGSSSGLSAGEEAISGTETDLSSVSFSLVPVAMAGCEDVKIPDSLILSGTNVLGTNVLIVATNDVEPVVEIPSKTAPVEIPDTALFIQEKPSRLKGGFFKRLK
jgi:hypothetical protein